MLCAFKGLFVLFWFGANVTSVVVNPSRYPHFLSYWGIWTIFLYFACSFGVCAYGVATKKAVQPKSAHETSPEGKKNS